MRETAAATGESHRNAENLLGAHVEIIVDELDTSTMIFYTMSISISTWYLVVSPIMFYLIPNMFV